MARTRKDRVLDDMMVYVFAGEVRHRCYDAIYGEAALVDALRSFVAAGVHSQETANRIWFGLRSILVAAAGISQLVGGRTGPRRVEREPLWRALAIERNSVIHQRSTRDSAEHEDDRLLRARAAGAKDFLMYAITPAGEPIPETPPGQYFLRFRMADGGVISFRDDEVSVTDLMTEIRRILALAEASPRLKQPRVLITQGQGRKPTTGGSPSRSVS